MTDQFQHVMVLASIIIGLGITHLLSGLGAAIERIATSSKPFRLSWVFGGWGLYLFVWLVSFWWWQFRLLSIVTIWTMGRYLFIIVYAVLLFLLVMVLLPRNWDAVADLDEYFLAKRRWFFSVFLLANIADLVDSYLKGGWDYVSATGPIANGLLIATLPVVLLGMRSRNVRLHTSMAIVLLIWQMAVNFDAFRWM